MRPIPRRRQRSCGMKSIKSVLVAAMVSLALEVAILSIGVAYAFARSAPMDIACENLASLADSVSLYIASEIDNEIFALQPEEVSMAMGEQNAGSRQALEALQEIESVTANIRGGAVEMNAGTEAILKEAARLSGLSQSVRGRSQPIAKAAEGINGAVAEIAQNTGSNAEAIGALVGMTGKFVI